ncbi:MAG: hypothetical protein APF76_02615 [Desulfitibacter sp. BRH_c19]|nr:MAG: hypothetical protein APF76_02615 [Desulfitibacter sp. BRH_c19]
MNLKSSFLKSMVLAIIFALFLLPVGAANGDVDNGTEVEEEVVENVENVENTESTGEAVEEEAKIISLSLEESIEMAVENHPDIAVAIIEHEQAKADLRKAKRDAKSIKDLKEQGLPGLYTYDTYLAERVLPKTMEMLEILADKGLDFKKSLLKFQAENAYYDVLKAESELENATDSLVRAKEQLRLAQVGLDVGVNAQADVLGAEVLVASQELTVSFAKNSLKQAEMDFNNLMGLALDDEVKLTSVFSFSPIEFNLEEIGEMAREKDLTYVQLNESVKVQEAAFDMAKGYYTPNVLTYQAAERDYEIAKLKLQNADQNLDLKIRKAYLNTETAKEGYALMEKSVEQASENYRLTKLRHDVGMATLLDLEKASGELDKAKTELVAAVYDYNLAATMLQHGIFDLDGMQ